MIYAVIDTNVLVSSFITKNPNAPTVYVVKSIMDGCLIPLYNDEILEEYSEVLSRPKFKLSYGEVLSLITTIKFAGTEVSRVAFEQDMPDEKDRPFYEVSLGQDGSFLVTGNLKHFPRTPLVVMPAEMVEILRRETSAE